MNKIRRVAEDLLSKYPTLFTTNFDKNKVALSQVSVIRARSIRNQLAGAITRLVQERGPSEDELAARELTIGEKIISEVERESGLETSLPGSVDLKKTTSEESVKKQETQAAQ